MWLSLYLELFSRKVIKGSISEYPILATTHLDSWKISGDFAVIAKAKISHFQNRCEIKGQDEWEEMEEQMNGSSKFNLLGVHKKMLLYPQRSRFLGEQLFILCFI